MSSKTIDEDKAVPSTSSSDLRESYKDETKSDAPEQSKIKLKKNTIESDNQSNQKKSNVIGTGPVYTGGGIKSTFHSVSYQLKLPMLFIIRGLDKKNCEFQVATEVKVADKLIINLLLLYDEDEIGFFQVKHKLDEKSKIKETQLLDKDGDFSVKNYFNSYKNILNEKELKDVLKGRKAIVIINTNIGIDESVLNSFEPVTASSTLSENKILALGTEEERNNYYIIKKESDLYAKLLVHLIEPPQRVAENLAKAIAITNNKSIEAEEIKKKELTRVKKDLLGVKFQVPTNFVASKNKNAKSGQVKVRTFLDTLVFAVKQLNEIELEDKIAKEIGDYMGHKDRQSIASKFQSFIQDWSKQREGRYLTKLDVEGQFAAWGYERLNQIRMEDIKKYKCAFKERNEVIKNLSNFLNTKNDTHTTQDVLCLYYREAVFSKIKLRQVFETFSIENINQQFIFCDIKDLVKFKNTKICPVKAFSSQICNTMFISLQHCKFNDDEVTILQRLLYVIMMSNHFAEQPISNKQRKRLIMSIPENKKSKFIKQVSFNRVIKTLSLNDFSNNFSDLDEISRRQLTDNGRIKLHGNQMTGLLSENELDRCIKDKILLKFISDELEINDAIEEKHKYNEEVKQYYVSRSLLPVMVKNDIKEDTLFRFVREFSLLRDIKNKEVVVVSSDEKLFYYFRETNSNVHWLKETNNKYFWITSQGTLTNLRKYVAVQDLDIDSDSDIESDLDSDIDSDTEHNTETKIDTDSDSATDLDLNKVPKNYIPITKITDVKNDVLLISADPGMGKSILLSHIAEQSKKEDNPFLVLKSNLTSAIDKLDSLKKEENVTFEQAIHFVFISTQIESPQTEESESAFNLLTVQEDGSIVFSPNARFDFESQLRAMVFCNLYNKEKLVLLLDGFDEIAPDYCKTTLNLLQTLKHSKVRKMWVTTRPYAVTKELENCLETFAYTLKPLSKNSQIKFFNNFWRQKIKSRYTEIRAHLKNFLKSLNVNTLSAIHKTDKKQNPNKKTPEFMSVPLHCYMLAKVLTKDFINFFSQTIDDANAMEPSTIVDLYSKFFDIKFDEILHNENLKNPKNLPLRKIKEQAVIDHGKLALLQIFDKELLAEMLSDEDTKTLIDRVNSGNEKTGIVTEVVGNVPQFVHRTFAEYFAAHYLAELLTSHVENKTKEAARLLLYNSVTNNFEYYHVLFTFFNYIVASRSDKKDIFEAAIGGNISKLSETENVNEIFDPLNRTPMHLIAINLSDVLKEFLKLHRKTDLTTATTMYSSLRNFIQRLCQSMSKSSPDALFSWTPAHYLAMNLCADSSGMFPFLIHYLSDDTPDHLHRTPIMLLIVRNSYINEWIQIYTLLEWISVNTQDKSCKTPLHYFLEKAFTPEPLDNFQKKINTICFLLQHGASIDIPDKLDITSEDLINSLFSDLSSNPRTKDTMIQFLEYQIQDLDKYIMDDINETSWNKVTEHVKIYLNTGGNYDLDSIKALLKCSLLLQLFRNYDKPILPVPDSEIFTLWHVDKLSPKIAATLVEETDLQILSTRDVDRNKIIFLLSMTKTIAPTLLLKCPHLINVMDSRGKTALHYAVINKNEVCVTSLIKNKANVDIPDNRGKTSAHINKLNLLYHSNSFEEEKINFIDTLTCEVASPLVLTMDLYPIRTQIDADFIVYVLRNTITIAHVLLLYYPDAVNLVDSKGKTALHYAVETKDTRAVCYLFDNNARANITDNDGKYPLHLDKENLFLLSKKIEEIENDPTQKRLKKRLKKSYNNIKHMLYFIDTLPFEVAKPLVLTMALVPPRESSDHLVLKIVLDKLLTIASVLWAEYSNLLASNRLKDCCSYFDGTNVSNEIMCRLLEIYCIEDFSDNFVKSNEVLKLAVGLHNSVRSNDLFRVQSVLKCVEPYNPIKHIPFRRKWVFPETLNLRGANINEPFVLRGESDDDIQQLLDALVITSPVEIISISRDYLPKVIDEVNVATSVINARSKDDGKTALHYAAEIGNADIVEALLSHGAYYNVPDFHDSTPSQIALTRANLAVLHLLETVKMLFNSLYYESYDNIAMEKVDGHLFRCICFYTKKPLIYLIREQGKNSLFDSFVKRKKEEMETLERISALLMQSSDPLDDENSSSDDNEDI